MHSMQLKPQPCLSKILKEIKFYFLSPCKIDLLRSLMHVPHIRSFSLCTGTPNNRNHLVFLNPSYNTTSILAWKIPWTEEPVRLQSMGSLRIGHNWATSLSLFTFMHWRRKWQPTPVFLPGESQGWGSLMGCRLWGRTESDTTEVT